MRNKKERRMQMPNSREIGSAFERKMAHLFETQRTHNRGVKDIEYGDLVDSIFWFQCRKRGEETYKVLYSWMKEETEQAEICSKIPVIILYSKGKRQALAVLDVVIFKKLLFFLRDKLGEEELKEALRECDETTKINEETFKKLVYLRFAIKRHSPIQIPDAKELSSLTEEEATIELRWREYVWELLQTKLSEENINETHKEELNQTE